MFEFIGNVFKFLFWCILLCGIVMGIHLKSCYDHVDNWTGENYRRIMKDVDTINNHDAGTITKSSVVHNNNKGK